MKRYTVSQARERLAELLDEAEQGAPVVIERRDVQYVVQAKRAPRRRPRTLQPLIETLDPAVNGGQWHWNWTAEGVRFTGRRRRA